MGCGSTCGCPFVVEGLHLIEPVVIMAEALDAQHMVAADMDYDQWLKVQLYLGEKDIAKREEEAAQKMIADMMGNPDQIARSTRKPRNKR